MGGAVEVWFVMILGSWRVWGWLWFGFVGCVLVMLRVLRFAGLGFLVCFVFDCGVGFPPGRVCLWMLCLDLVFSGLGWLWYV